MNNCHELAPQYDPKDVEKALYTAWEKSGAFGAAPDGTGKPYVIVIPPPNVTNVLHMGHALNITVQDILIRWQRMKGMNALWVPGTDHAGIATQNVVEKELRKRGILRDNIGREAFLKEVWKWRDEYGSRILLQLRALGVSCDWPRLRFTMDEGLSRAVTTAFVSLYEKGLIYRGNRIINWCPRCATALSDEEVDYHDEQGSLWFIRYPLKDGGSIEVATTRPETMLGDTGVAVNPKDERYRGVVGKHAMLPLMEREIPVVADESVDPEFGTGAVKVTPSHDPNDFVTGGRHGLAFVTVMNPDGTMSEKAGVFKGLDRFVCRQRVIEALTEKGLLIRVEPHLHRVGHCSRCSTIIEPYLSEQWFVKMAPLAGPAIEAAERGDLRFYPERWKKIYLQWLTGIRDWCISRQIWWGHRIPVWYCADKKCPPIVVVEPPVRCPACGGTALTRDPDVLDTWFSSWLWPFSVFGWPEKTKDLDVFYPTAAIVTAQDILFFWIARMVMAGCEFKGGIPFSDVYIHGTVRDETGRKMSKSLGNGIDPVEIIENYGADSLRFSLISMTAVGQDVFLSPTFYLKGRNFINKIWNASRFIFMNADAAGCGRMASFDVDGTRLTAADRWILATLDATVVHVEDALKAYRFNDAINRLYDFFWHDFCDWYLEISKLYQEDRDHVKTVTLPVLLRVLAESLKLLHPFMPFVTERLWQTVRDYYDTGEEMLVRAAWPESSGPGDEAACAEMADVREVVTMIRDIKTRFQIPIRKKIPCFYDGGPLSGERRTLIMHLAGVGEFLPFDRREDGAANMIMRNLSSGRWGVSLAGIADLDREAAKLTAEREKLTGYLAAVTAKLGNENFVKNAPAAVVEKERARKADVEEKLKKLEEDIAFLKK